jgi:hypothetical protein
MASFIVYLLEGVAIRFRDSTCCASSNMGENKRAFYFFCQPYQIIVVPSWSNRCEDTWRVCSF